MVRVLWPETEAEPVVQPEPALPCLLLQDFQPFVPPYPFHPIVVHMPAGVVQQSGDHPIAISPVGASKRDDVLRQPFFVRGAARNLAVRVERCCPRMRQARRSDMPSACRT
jgi:hypothetical protein